MTMQYSLAVRNAQLEAVRSLPLAPDNQYRITLFGGTVLPVGGLAGGALWISPYLDKSTTPLWNAPSGGVMTINPAAAALLRAPTNNEGTATFFRLSASNTVPWLQGTVGLPGSGADMIMDTVTFVSGQYFTIISATITNPNG